MGKPSLWIRNNSGSDIDIEDLGITLPSGSPGTSRDIASEFGYAKLAMSDDLYDVIDNQFANIDCSIDGATWSLTEAEVKDILSTFTLADHKDIIDGNPHGVDAADLDGDALIDQINGASSSVIDDSHVDLGTHNASSDHDGRYYTESEVDNFFEGEDSGKKQVDWGNVINKPTTGTAGQYAPVLSRVLETGAASAPSEPGDAAADNAYWYVDNQATPHLWKTVGSGWVDQGAISTGDRFIDLNDADESILEWDGSTYTDTDPVEGYEVTVRDNGDGKQAGYVYNGSSKTPANSWVFRFDVDVDGTQSLDDAYEDGATINVDNTNGPVKIDASSSSSAPIELTQQAAAPSSNLAAGQMCVIGGKMYVYDGTRSKWLSVERKEISFGMNANNLSRVVLEYLGSVPGNKAGYRLPQNATLVGITVDSKSSHTADYETRVKGSGSWTTRITVTSATGGHDMTLNIDFNAADVPTVRANPSAGSMDFPTCTLIFAFRP